MPALFTLFGRKAFWPKIPKYLQGQSEKPQNGFWNRFAKLVVRRPGLFGGLVGIILIVTASNVTTIDFEFNSVKKTSLRTLGLELVMTLLKKILIKAN